MRYHLLLVSMGGLPLSPSCLNLSGLGLRTSLDQDDSFGYLSAPLLEAPMLLCPFHLELCVCMHSLYEHVWACVCRPDTDVRDHPQLLFHLFTEAVSQTQSSLKQPVLLATSIWGSPVSAYPGHHAHWHLLGFEGSELLFSPLLSKHFNH